jgi:hypothetical protein
VRRRELTSRVRSEDLFSVNRDFGRRESKLITCLTLPAQYVPVHTVLRSESGRLSGSVLLFLGFV